MTEPAHVVLAVDGNSLVHRSFHAQADCGHPDWAVRGLLTQLVAAVERVAPTHVVVGFDDPDRSARRERWPFYKAHRVEKLDSLVAQLAAAADAVRDLGLTVVAPPGLEADDVLASAAAWTRAHSGRTVVVTSDRDAFALIDASTSVLRIINGGVEASPLMTPERLPLLLGVRPDQYRDYAALRGDASDNLPGVRGIGPLLAARVLAEFGSAAAAFDDLEAVRERIGAGVARRLAATGARAAWTANVEIMAMHTDVALGWDGSAAPPDGPGLLPLDGATIARVYRRHNLVWTVGRAVRAFTGRDDEPPVEPAVSAWEPAVGAFEPATRPWRSGRRSTPPRLTRHGRSFEQLSLFE